MARLILYLVLCWSTLAAILQPRLPGAFGMLALAVATAIPIVAVVARGGWGRHSSAAFRLFIVRPVLYTQLLLPLTIAGGLAGLGIGAMFGAPLTGGRIGAGSVLAIMLVLLVWGYIGSHWLVVRELEATIPGLPIEFAGLRIAQLSDLHVGPHTSRRFLARVARTTAALAPDLIAVTGDLVDDRAEDVEHFAAGLGRLRAPLGVYLIPGNHDIYAGWTAVERALADIVGATILVNDSRELVRGDARLAIVGTGDPAARRGGGGAAPDIERSLRDVPSHTTVIALAHNPALWPELAARGVALTLSGHTHWGQFAVPWLGWSLASPFQARAMGTHQADSSLLYIHPGTGYWGLPFRVGARPEVAVITLVPGPRAAIHMAPSRGAPCRVTFAGSTRRRPRSAPRQRPAPA